MLDGYHVITLTYREAPLEMIGKAGVREPAGETLQALRHAMGWDELYYLATCNRVIFLFYSQAPQPAHLVQRVFFQLRPEWGAEENAALTACARLLHGADAVRHLLEVASSMDSLVVGEREIIRQLRQAYDVCRGWGLPGDHIRLLMRFTIETAKEVYTTTGIGQRALSVVALAFNEMLRVGLPREARVLLVGAGQTNALFAKFLKKYGYHNVAVFNRSVQKAHAVAAAVSPSARAFSLEALGQYTEGFDALIVCTAASEPIITPALYHRLMAAESNRKVVVDLSVPNNVDRQIPAIFPVHFIEIEGLREVARQNMDHREQERDKAAQLIERRLYDYRQLWHERQVVRAFANLPDDMRAVKEKAIDVVFAREFEELDSQTQDLVRRMLGYMEKKAVAIPIKTARKAAVKALNRSRVEEGGSWQKAKGK